MNKKYSVILFYVFSAGFILFDQITKLWIKGFNFSWMSHKGMFLGETRDVIGTLVQFVYVENPGMAFGISFGPLKVLLSLFSVIASIALIYYLYKLTPFSKIIRLGIAFILAGAVGNLIDRVFYGVIFHEAPLFWGRVVDFIQVDIPDIHILDFNYSHWPVFNVADSCVSIGIVILLLFHKKIPSFKELFGAKLLNENPENTEN